MNLTSPERAFGPLVLIVTGPLLLFPLSWPLPIVLMALLALCLPAVVRKLRYGFFIGPSPVRDLVLALLAIFLPLSIWVSPIFEQATWIKTTGLLWACAVFFEVTSWGLLNRGQNRGPTDRPAAWLTTAYLLLGLLVCATGLLGLYTLYKLPVIGGVVARLPNLTSATLGRPEGFHPNEVAGTLILFAPLCLALALAKTGPTEISQIRFHPMGLLKPSLIRPARVIIILLAIVFSGGLILVQSRGALMGWLLATSLILLLSGRRGRLLLVAVILTVAAAVLFIGPAEVVASLRTDFYREMQYGGSGFVRLEIWRRAAQIASDFPLTGVGLGTFRYVIHKLMPWPQTAPWPRTGDIPLLNPDWGHAHNLLLQTLLDFGLLGALLFAIILIIPIILLVRLLRSPSITGSDRYWVLGIGASFVGYLVYSLTDAISLGARPNVTFWFLLGLVMVANQEHPVISARGLAAIPALQRRPRVLLSAAAIFLLILCLLWAWLRPKAALNWTALQATDALFDEPGTLTKAVESAAETAQQSCHARWYLGILLQEQGDLAARDAAWTELLNCTDRFLPYLAIIDPGNEALARYAVQKWPNNPTAYFWLAVVLSGTEPEQAAEQYREGLRLDPADGYRWMLLGDLLLADAEATDRDLIEAMDAYLAACQNGDPRGSGCWRAGQVAERIGDIQAAISYYRLSQIDAAKQRADLLEGMDVPAGDK